MIRSTILNMRNIKYNVKIRVHRAILEKRKLETIRAPFAFAKTAVMCIYMQIFAYLTDTSADRKPLNARRMHRHEYSSTRGPEDFAGHTIEAAKPSTGFAAEAATLSRPSRIRRRKFHVVESGALTVRWIDTP